jgi:hypothetical protein
MKDYENFKQLLENSKCSVCNEGFIETNKPTLDRKNNKLSHTKDNLVPCCGYCNCVKADTDEHYTKLHTIKKICNEDAFTIHIGKR